MHCRPLHEAPCEASLEAEIAGIWIEGVVERTHSQSVTGADCLHITRAAEFPATPSYPESASHDIVPEVLLPQKAEQQRLTMLWLRPVRVVYQ